MFSSLMDGGASDGGFGRFRAFAPSLTGGTGTPPPFAEQTQPQLTPIGAMLNGAGLDAGASSAPIGDIVTPPPAGVPANPPIAASSGPSTTMLILGGLGLLAVLYALSNTGRE